MRDPKEVKSLNDEDAKKHAASIPAQTTQSETPAIACVSLRIYKSDEHGDRKNEWCADVFAPGQPPRSGHVFLADVLPEGIDVEALVARCAVAAWG